MCLAWLWLGLGLGLGLTWLAVGQFGLGGVGLCSGLFGYVRVGSVRFGSARFRSVGFGWVRFGQVEMVLALVVVPRLALSCLPLCVRKTNVFLMR